MCKSQEPGVFFCLPVLLCKFTWHARCEEGQALSCCAHQQSLESHLASSISDGEGTSIHAPCGASLSLSLPILVPTSRGQQSEDVCTSCPSTKFPLLYLALTVYLKSTRSVLSELSFHTKETLFSQFVPGSPGCLYSLLLICQPNL